jgi:hypothetical protein
MKTGSKSTNQGWVHFAGIRDNPYFRWSDIHTEHVSLGCIENIMLADIEGYGTVEVGWFEGPTNAMAISADEEWCVTAYGGFNATRLKPPWMPVGPGMGSDVDNLGNGFTRVGELVKTGSQEEITWTKGHHFEEVEALEGHLFALRTYPDKEAGRILEFIVDADRKEYWLERDWIDEERQKLRTMEESFSGLLLNRVEQKDKTLWLWFGDDENHGICLTTKIAYETGVPARREKVKDWKREFDIALGESRQMAAAEIECLVGSKVSYVDTPKGGLKVQIQERGDWIDPEGILRVGLYPTEVLVLAPARAGAWEMTTQVGTIQAPGENGWPRGTGPARVLGYIADRDLLQ